MKSHLVTAPEGFRLLSIKCHIHRASSNFRKTKENRKKGLPGVPAYKGSQHCHVSSEKTNILFCVIADDIESLLPPPVG